ncbi:MAG: segregation/condensation protein A [Oscillospiraceae bacterium]|jgi:segregation and condensation protein A|nr:segregation/condensation protein A [Oscillospiraceae bacterium]
MTDFNYKSPVYEGPLDLMLALVEKQKLDIRDIEISILLEQFLLYLEEMRARDIELAGEFIAMAAHLIYIKTAVLLPKHEVEELKKELSGALIEYALLKEAATALAKLFNGGAYFTRKPAELEGAAEYRLPHQSSELVSAAIEAVKSGVKPPEVQTALEIVPHKEYASIYAKFIYVMRRLTKHKVYPIRELYFQQSRSEQAAVFIVLLELARRGVINFVDNDRFIELTRSDGVKVDEVPVGAM